MFYANLKLHFFLAFLYSISNSVYPVSENTARTSILAISATYNAVAIKSDLFILDRADHFCG